MNKNTIIKFLYYSLLIIVFVAVVGSIYKFSYANIIECDDKEFLFPPECSNFYHKFIEQIYAGKIISNFTIILLNFDLPHLFSFHPAFWAQTGGAIIKGIFYFITFMLLSSTAFLTRKNNILFPLLILAAYIFIVTNFFGLIHMESLAFFYCFIFPFIFFLLFWNTFIKKYLGLNENINYILLFIYGILTGLSAEITTITTVLALIFLTGFSIIFKIKLEKKLIFTAIISSGMGILTYFLNPNFTAHAMAKRSSFNSYFDIWAEYLSGYKSTLIHQYLPFLLIILALSIYIFITIKSEKKKRLLIVLYSILIGSFCFYTSLIFAGRHCAYNYLYIVHFDTIIQMLIVFIYIIFIGISFIQNNKVFYTVLLILLSFSLFKVDKFYRALTDYYIDGFIYNYTNEKIIAYYAYRNMPIITENSVKNRFSDSNTNYIRSLYNPKYDWDINSVVYKDTQEEVMEEYKKNGGKPITDEEIKKHNFNLLLDKNFVLGEEDKITK